MYHMHAQLPPTPTPSPLISPSEMLKALQKELNVSTHMYDIHRYAHVHLYIYIYLNIYSGHTYSHLHSHTHTRTSPPPSLSLSLFRYKPHICPFRSCVLQWIDVTTSANYKRQDRRSALQNHKPYRFRMFQRQFIQIWDTKFLHSL